MRKGFEINADYRLMENSELVYMLTSNRVFVNKVQEKEIGYDEHCNFEEVLAKMTPGKCNLVMAGVELYKRTNSKITERPVIRCSKDIFDYMQPILGDIKTEECWTMFLNQAVRVIKKIRISSGGYTSTQIDLRVILKEALLCNATAFIYSNPQGLFQYSFLFRSI